MASTDKARPSKAPDTDAQKRTEEASPQEGRDGDNTLAYTEATLTLLSAWLDNLRALVLLEFSRTLAAGKRILALQLLLLPLAITLVLSLCGGAGLIGYRYTQSIYIGFAVFVLAQAVILAAIILYQRKLSTMLGFSETKRQAKAAVQDVFEIFK